MADPDLQIRGKGGGGHPDPEIRGGGAVFIKKCFLALRVSVWSKNLFRYNTKFMSDIITTNDMT